MSTKPIRAKEEVSITDVPLYKPLVGKSNYPDYLKNNDEIQRQLDVLAIGKTLSEKPFAKRYSVNEEVKQEFDNLIKEWVSAIKYKSSESQQVNHDAFFRILVIAKDVLPFVFEEFSKRPFMAWVRVLPAITGKNVATNAKSFREAVEMWVEWGKENGYLKR